MTRPLPSASPRAVDVVHRVPVLVVGGGPSGLAAAIAAARAGAEVCLLERFGCFGGNLTVVGVEGLAWYRHEATVEASVMFHLSGVDKQAFLSGIRAGPATYADWSAGEWAVETSGKEDGLFSPFLRKPFAQAIRDG